ncbi:MAG TPA: ABC transporter substrate-binding protein [Ktedonobacteraceae bacterium]|nr:ABC transporter substrate-binding protein [Ktedonobacteraceae bacterium]
MVPVSLPKKWQKTTAGIFLGVAFIVLPLLIAACGSTTTTGNGTPTSNALACSTAPNNSAPTPTPYPASSDLTAPTGLITPGTLTVGSDTTYPPQEFIDTNSGAPTGFDVDLVTAMAQKLGLQAKVVTANFSTIIDDLSAKRYDVVISALTINEDRLKKVDFVPYFQAGESLIVQKGNPQNIQCVPNLCGMKVAVQSGTVELDDLNAGSKACTSAGKPAIQLTVLKDQTAVIQELANKRVDATYQDSPVSDYYLKQNPGQFEIGGTVANAAAEGIAIRKDDAAMLNALRAAFSAIKSDGTYDNLFNKWQLNAAQKIG